IRPADRAAPPADSLSSRRGSAALPPLHPFPTRRSSDLAIGVVRAGDDHRAFTAWRTEESCELPVTRLPEEEVYSAILRQREVNRSEEHTSELQSRENLVCRLLLEKKKLLKSYWDFRAPA